MGKSFRRSRRSRSGTGRRFALAGLALFILAAGTAGAAIVPWLDLEEMTARAEVIALGRVEKVESNWTPDGRIIVTLATIEIEKGLKGGPWRRVVVRTPGGRVGDRMMVASGAPVFREGERLVVFLERPGGAPGEDAGAGSPGAPAARGAPPGESPFGIVGWNQGRLAVRRDARTGRDLVDAPSGDAVQYVGPDGRPVDAARGRRAPEELGRFLGRIRAILDRGAERTAP